MERECLPVLMAPMADAVDVLPSAAGHEYYEGSNCDLFPSAAPVPSKGCNSFSSIKYLASKPKH